MNQEILKPSAVLGEWYDRNTITPPENTEVLVWRGESVAEGFCEIAHYLNGQFHTGPGYKHPEWILEDVTHWWWRPGVPGSLCYPITHPTPAATPENTTGPGADDLHLWWELSYAQYLTIPRSALQSMPDVWQARMAALLKELDERIEWRPKQGCYYVELRDYGYQFNVEEGVETFVWKDKLPDPLMDYERGRRRLPLNPIPHA